MKKIFVMFLSILLCTNITFAADEVNINEPSQQLNDIYTEYSPAKDTAVYSKNSRGISIIDPNINNAKKNNYYLCNE